MLLESFSQIPNVSGITFLAATNGILVNLILGVPETSIPGQPD
jgi:hypothetical protein